MTRRDIEREELHRVLDLCSELTSVASADGGLEEIVRTVADGAHVSAAVVDDGLSVLAQSGDRTPPDRPSAGDVLRTDAAAVAQLIAAAAGMRRALSLPAFGNSAASLVVAPILVGDDCVAYFITAGRDVDETGEDDRIMITEHAAMVSAVVLGRLRVVAVAAGRARRELFEGLLLVRDHSQDEIDNWAQHLGLSPEDRHRILVVAADSASKSAFQPVNDHIESFVSARLPTAVVVNRDAEVVTVVPGADDDALARRLVDVARACKRLISAQFGSMDLTAGLSDPHIGAAQISTAYAEARRAVDVGKLLPDLSEVVVFADLGVHRLLAQVRDTAELGRFVDSVLGPLVEYDRANGVEYCKTLSVYFHEQGSPQRAAELLHTHPNTVTYRVRRAEQIAGRDLSSYGDRLAVQVALEILNGLGGTR